MKSAQGRPQCSKVGVYWYVFMQLWTHLACKNVCMHIYTSVHIYACIMYASIWMSICMILKGDRNPTQSSGEDEIFERVTDAHTDLLTKWTVTLRTVDHRQHLTASCTSSENKANDYISCRHNIYQRKLFTLGLCSRKCKPRFTGPR